MILPPGTLLQLMYLNERLATLTPGRFYEIGVGRGYLSANLLARGWSGVGFELDSDSAAAAREGNQEAIRDGRYSIERKDWLRSDAVSDGTRADVVISCMVLEHLDEASEALYLKRCRERLAPGGRGILLVPGSPRDWGIEDEIAGHQRRYTRESLAALLEANDARVAHMAGLTYPLSNLLLPLSNRLVVRAERDKLVLDADARTRASGRREVVGKTVFPAVAGLLLNQVALYPLHLLQKALRSAERALVLYAEFSWS
jgi:SAM-dependent methyltransferase